MKSDYQVGDRVDVTVHYYRIVRHQPGVVVGITPMHRSLGSWFMVRLDGEKYPLRVGADELAPLPPPAAPVTR